jgi:hypothetical protein
MKERFKASLPANFTLPTTDHELQAALTQLFNDQGRLFNDLTEALKAENREKYGLPEISNVELEVITTTSILIGISISTNILMNFISLAMSTVISDQL